MAVEIYCDGACIGNGRKTNRGGWGAVIKGSGKTREISGGELNTTNQRMEIMSCIKALEAVATINDVFCVYSDSAYLINCMNDKWYVKWLRNGWLNASKNPVENRDLWERLLALIDGKQISFRKVRGHSGHTENEMADELASTAAQKLIGE